VSDRHGYDGPRGFYAYGQRALINSATLYFTPGFLKEPRAGWIVDGFESTLLAEVEGVLVRHADPVRVWRLTGNFDAPYPGLFAYQAIWPD
jgi:hypothetical protein